MQIYFEDLRNKTDFDPKSIENLEEISQYCSYIQESIAYRPEIIQYFIPNIKNIDHQDDSGQTALQYLISRSMFDFADELIQKMLRLT